MQQQHLLQQQQYANAGAQIPDGVRNFIGHFHRHILDNNVYELHSVYENSFNKLTEKYFPKTTWPEPEIIAPLVNDGNVILFPFLLVGVFFFFLITLYFIYLFISQI